MAQNNLTQSDPNFDNKIAIVAQLDGFAYRANNGVTLSDSLSVGGSVYWGDVIKNTGNAPLSLLLPIEEQSFFLILPPNSQVTLDDLFFQQLFFSDNVYITQRDENKQIVEHPSITELDNPLLSVSDLNDLLSSELIDNLGGSDSGLLVMLPPGFPFGEVISNFETHRAIPDVTRVDQSIGDDDLLANLLSVLFSNAPADVANNNTPTITVSTSDVTEENLSAGDVIATFSSSDLDGDSLTHSVLNDPNGYFSISGTDVILTQAGVDAINNDSLDLTSLTVEIQADDGTFQSSDSDSVGITRVNDNAPIISVTASSVTEESVSVGDVIATFSSSDPDGDSLTHSVLNDPNGYFSISGTDVTLTQAGVDAINNDTLDLTSLSVEVQADDGTFQSSDSDSVGITRVNDNAPIISVTASSVTEESVSVGDVIATFSSSDPDGDSLTHSVLNDPNGYFSISGTDVTLTQAGVDAINNDSLDLTSLTVEIQADDGTFQSSDSDSVGITRVNDNAPIISVTASNVTEESVSVGDVIATFSSSDPDGDSLTHSVLNDPNGYFSISGTDVILTQAGVDAINNDSLDLTSLSVEVQADDGTFQSSDSDSVGITRVNDNAPIISVTASNVTEESVSVGDVIATFSSSDPDGDSLTHSVLNDPNGYFSISGTDVTLTQAGVDAINNDSLDLTSLSVEIQADDGTFQSSDSDSLGITRVNDNAPIISVTASSVTEESVSVGDVIATFSSSDPDGDSLTHSVLNDPNGYFSISGTDVILTQAGVDAINNDSLDLTSLTVEIQADDGTFQSSDSDSVGITRVNDNAPIISVTASNVTEESVSVGDVIATFSSSDPDGDSLTHSVLNDPNGYFSISGTDVTLTQAGVDAINNDSLDLTSLSVEVQADDGTFQSSDSDSLGITRVNDNAPIISVTASNVTEESVSVGDVIATFSSSDPDGDSLTHSVLNDPNGYFSISGTDVILTQAGVDAINNDSLDLTSLSVEVQADDGTFQSSDSDSLGITRVNDNAPIISVTASSVTEESVSVGDVIATFSSSDPDGDSLTHSVLNDPNGYFSISGTDVILTQAGVDAINNDSLDLTSLSVEVQADDGTFQSSDSDSVGITRVNDNAPIISVTASNVTEESVSVGDVIATFSSSDPDGDSLTHSVLNDPNGYFSISGTDVILTQAGVDAINNDSLDLTSLSVEVQADDGTFQSSDSDSLGITRVNDNAPIISVTASSVTEESVSVGDVIATFSSSDPDGDSLTHSVLNDPNGYFSISGTDVILTQAGVDAINNDSLDLTSLSVEVQADDGTFQSSDSDSLGITRVNDNAPIISVTASSVTEESVSVGDVIATFSSSDPDGDSLTHSVLNDPNGYFSISGTDVTLTQAGVDAINNDSLDLTSLSVEVQADDGTFQSSDSDSVGITRVNDNAPIISVTASSVTEESVSVGDVIATFSSSDPDGDSLTHSVLNDPNGYFSISGTDVTLTQAGVDAINNDTLDLTSLSVEVQADDGTFQSSDSDSVGITRVNDNAPIISVTASNVTEESVSVGDVIATFSSSDPDGDSLTHSVLNDPNGYFSISGTDVTLTQAGVDAINNDSLDLTSLSVEVQADDGTFQSSDSDSVGITRVNDNAPIISVTASNVTEESVSVGDVIATFSSSDPDGDSLTHSVLNDPNGYFSISGTDVILTQAGVDAINNDTLDLTSLSVEVQADDGTFQSSDSDSVGITRVNDNAPIISVTASSVTEESVSVGDVIATFSSSDPDGDSLTHSVLNDPNGYFSISGTDVTLTQAGVDAINNDSLDLTSLSVEVQADDGTFQSSDSDSVGITRVNDNAPIISVTASNVTEESVSVGDVIATFSSSDPDGDSLTHSVLNDPNGYFSISGTDVTLTQAGVDAINNDSLDLTSLSVEVQADDGTFQSSDSDSLGITRVNDNAPIISVTASSVTEESVSVGDVIATFSSSDPDGDSLTHSVLNDPNGYFSINGTNVTLTQAGVDAINNDILGLTSLNVEVQADDGTFQSSDSDTSAITRIDSPPTDIVFSAAAVPENASTSQVVATVTSVEDLDQGDTHTFTLLDDYNGRFTIDSVTGDISVVAQATPDVGGSQVLWFDASDASSITETNGVVSAVSDLSGSGNGGQQNNTNNQPSLIDGGISGQDALYFDGVNDFLSISNSSDINTSNVSARSFAMTFQTSDDVTSRQVIYEEGAHVNGFNMYIDNGQLYVGAWSESTGWTFQSINTPIAADTAYTFTSVFDGSSGSYTAYLNGVSIGAVSTGAVMSTHGGAIALGAYNGGTEFHDGHISGGQGAYFKGHIGEFSIYNTALDDDTRSEIEFGLMDQWTPTVPGALDHETNTSVDIVVQTTDSTGQTYSEPLTIDITDVNDNEPVISVTAANVTEDSVSVGDVIATFTSSDPDSTANLTHSVLNDPNGYFSINGTDVALTQNGVDAINDDALDLTSLTIEVEVDDGLFQSVASDDSTITRINDDPTNTATLAAQTDLVATPAPLATVNILSGQPSSWTLDGSQLQNINNVIQNNANFGPTGTVETDVNIIGSTSNINNAYLNQGDVYFDGYVNQSNFTNGELNALNNWVNGGGILISTNDSTSYDAVSTYYGLQIGGSASSNWTVTTDPAVLSHPILDGPFGSLTAGSSFQAAGTISYFNPSSLEPDDIVLAYNNGNTSQPTIVLRAVGDGHAIFLSDEGPFRANVDTGVINTPNEILAANIFAWSIDEVAGEVYSVDISSIDLGDTDAYGNDLTLTLQVDDGSLVASGAYGVTVSTNPSGDLVLNGTLTELNNFLDDTTAITYDGTVNTTLTIIANDSGNTGLGGGTDVVIGSTDLNIPLLPPVVLDLDGDGIEYSETQVLFDVDNDGTDELVNWVGADDGILAYDKNGDGEITDANEISFVGYKEDAKTDLEGLTAFDTNADGQFSASDDQWSSFSVWQDINQNGISEQGELISLNKAGIFSIGLQTDGNAQSPVDGVYEYGRGTYQLTDGSQGEFADVAFAYQEQDESYLVESPIELSSIINADDMLEGLLQQGVPSYDNNMGSSTEEIQTLLNLENGTAERFSADDPSYLNAIDANPNYSTDSALHHADDHNAS